MTPTEPVADWTTDFDIFDPGYRTQPYPIWDDLRERCPVAHTDRHGGAWMPTRYADVAAVAHDVEHFSSRQVGVTPMDPNTSAAVPDGLPPIESDPPVHTWARRLILPWFSHRRVAELEPGTRELCSSLAARVASAGGGDAAADYAQHIPVRVVARVLGVPDDMADTFVEWVRDVQEFAHDPERRTRGANGLIGYFSALIEERTANPGDDLVSYLLQADIDGEPVPVTHVLGTAGLVLIAGIDTTWSALGSCLWHFATHPDDRHRFIADEDIRDSAIEELLRAYSPVTMARIANDGAEIAGCPIPSGDRVLLNFAAANRDPDMFERPDEVLLDRGVNRHAAFGLGIHRCAGSNLARMELRVALEEWLAHIPDYELTDPSAVEWAGGQVRGPRTIPITTTRDTAS